LLFGVDNQALVSFRCSPEMSCHSSNLNSSTSKLCLVPRRGWAQRIEMFLTPSTKHLQEQSSTIWWTNTCPCHGGNTTLRPHSSMALGACPPSSSKVLFIANVAPRVVGEVVTLSPRDNETCSMCIVEGEDINLSDTRRLCRLRIIDA
jgi:hypothetical protein